jgi:hypothetical protein
LITEVVITFPMIGIHWTLMDEGLNSLHRTVWDELVLIFLQVLQRTSYLIWAVTKILGTYMSKFREYNSVLANNDKPAKYI